MFQNMQILVVQEGTSIETVCLSPGSNHLRGVWKDQILVVIVKQQVLKIQTISRRFRVKFASTESSSGVSNCKNCILVLSHYINIQDVKGNN
ncbi:hypothetical protein C0J52_15813 [Blattella germanica]|nr:hypothetical protein C0J52_15813 [Blattella germanica]